MYKYYDKVTDIFDEMLDTQESIQMSLIENENRPLNAITYFDISTYLDALSFSDNHKANVYNSLKKFFDFTYNQGLTPEIMSKVVKLDIKRKKKTDYF